MRKKRLKCLSTFIAGLLFVQTANAISNPKYFIVNMKDGKDVAYALADNPRVVTIGDVVKLVAKNVTVEYQLKNVSKFLLSSETTSIKSMAVDGGTFSQTAGSLSLSGFPAGATVRVYAVNGSVVKSLAVGSNGQLDISLAQYPTGMYIIKVDGETFKFIKR